MIKNTFLGHFLRNTLTDKQTHRLTHSQTHRKYDLYSCLSQLKKITRIFQFIAKTNDSILHLRNRAIWLVESFSLNWKKVLKKLWKKIELNKEPKKRKKKTNEKTRTYETSQSCDRVHLGHLKKKIEKNSKVENQNISYGRSSWYFIR